MTAFGFVGSIRFIFLGGKPVRSEFVCFFCQFGGVIFFVVVVFFFGLGVSVLFVVAFCGSGETFPRPVFCTFGLRGEPFGLPLFGFIGCFYFVLMSIYRLCRFRCLGSLLFFVGFGLVRL